MVSKIVVPMMSVNDEFATLVSWYCKDGAVIKKGDRLCLIETLKATQEIYAEKDGFVRRTREENEKIPVNDVVGYIVDSLEEALPQTEPVKSITEINATLKAKILAEKLKVDLSAIKSKGTIKEKDVQEFFDHSNVNKIQYESAIQNDLPEGVNQYLIAHQQPLSSIQKQVKDHVIYSIKHNVSAYISIEVELDNSLEYLKKLMDQRSKCIRLNDMFIRATALALKRFPKFNAFLWHENIVYYKDINISMIMDYQENLISPVIRNADQKNIKEIAIESMTLQMKAMRNELIPNDFQDGTFTITNLSSFGVRNFIPIINGYQSAILGISSERLNSRSQEKLSKVLNLELSYDHRIHNGVMAAKFLNAIKKEIEEGYQAWITD